MADQASARSEQPGKAQRKPLIERPAGPLAHPQRLAHDLHVLLRHRLLLDTEVGEGAVRVVNEALDLPTGNVKERQSPAHISPISSPPSLPCPAEWTSTATRSPSSASHPATSMRTSLRARSQSRQRSAIPVSPTHVPGDGPSAITNSIFESARLAELK